MKIVCVIIACLSVGLVLVVGFYPRGAVEQTLPAAAVYTVKGDHTLASLAAEINDPDVFSYDPGSGVATSALSLVIEGRLQIGDPDDAKKNEILEMATELCGDLRIRVPRSGELAIYNSSIATKTRIIQYGACTQGYGFIINGKLTMDHGTIQYMSDQAMGWGLREDAVAVLRDSNFTECDGPAMRFQGIGGKELIIERCSFGSTGEWGLIAAGDGTRPIVIRDSVLNARIGPILMTEGDPHVRLINCSFDKTKVHFTRQAGKIEVAWLLDVIVEPGAAGTPVEGLRVVAKSDADCGIPETKEGFTDENGKVQLELTEWIALPTAARLKAGVNDSTPHTILVYAKGSSKPLAKPYGVRMLGKNQKAVIKLGGADMTRQTESDPDAVVADAR